MEIFSRLASSVTQDVWGGRGDCQPIRQPSNKNSVSERHWHIRFGG